MAPLELYRLCSVHLSACTPTQHICSLILMQMRSMLWRELEGKYKKIYISENITGRIYIDPRWICLCWPYKQTQLIWPKQQVCIYIYMRRLPSSLTLGSLPVSVHESEAVKWLFINWHAATFFFLSTFIFKWVLWHRPRRWNEYFWCRECLLPAAVDGDEQTKCWCWNAEY